MPTTSWLNMRAEIARVLGYRSVLTTTGHIAANTVTSTNLIPHAPAADKYNGWYLKVQDSGSSENGKVRRVTDYDTAGALTTSDPAFTVDNNARTVALYRNFHPDDILTVFIEAANQLYPSLVAVKDSRTLLVGAHQRVWTVPTAIRQIDSAYLSRRLRVTGTANNVLVNESLEDWTSGVADSWALVGSGATQTQEQNNTTTDNFAVLEGGSSAKIIVTTNSTTFLQSVTPDVAIEGVEVNFAVWVYCTVASRVSARIEAGSNTSGTAHTGSGWERLTVSANMASSDTSFSVGIIISADTAMACYVDEAIATIGQGEIPEGIWEEITNYRFISPVDGASNAGTIELTDRLPQKEMLRLVGRGYLSTLSLDTDTIEVDGDTLQVLANKTRQLLVDEMVGQTTGQTQIEWIRQSSRYKTRSEDALDDGAASTIETPRTITIPDGVG